MTTTDPPILRNSALATPFVVLAVGLALGWSEALGAAVGAGLVLANLWVLSVVGPRLVSSLAREELASRGVGNDPSGGSAPGTGATSPPVFWMVALLAKFVLLIGAFALLFRFLPAFGLLLGFVPLMLGTLGTGITLALHETAEETP